MNLKDMRRIYDAGPLYARDFDPDPIVQFQRWFDEAEQALRDLPEPYQHPNAMALATTGANGAPAVRIVLLKGVGARGFVFFTDRNSRKGQELDANPQASLALYWALQERQVCIDGTVERTTREEDERYFSSRPRESQLSAASSHQSRPVKDRAALEAGRNAFVAAAEDPLVTPQRWGGYRLKPTRIEFWQGRPDRLHDRLVYIATEDGFRLERLQP